MNSSRTSQWIMMLPIAAGMGGSAFAQNDELDDGLRRIHVTPTDVPVKALEATTAFEGLSKQEKLYAYWMAQAAWRGAMICSAQVSVESPEIFDLVLRVGMKHPQRLRIAAQRAGIRDDDLARFDDYSARVLSNHGNYVDFGDTKFIPSIPADTFRRILEVASRLDTGPGPGDPSVLQAFDRLRGAIYDLSPAVRQLGLPPAGVTSYYGADVTQEDVDFVKRFLESRGIEAWNTRVFKQPVGQERILKVTIASIRRSEQRETFEGKPIFLAYGDYSPQLEGVVAALVKALDFAANDTQREMIKKYIDHFREGHIALHKDAMRAWVKDVGPAVETNLGFIETYRDPAQVRAEWEGLVAVVNRAQSEKLGKLVDAAPQLIPLLPWGKDFEKDTFQRPDFTSLDVVAFCNSGIPAGINIPNYDDIRMNEGFKNVSLGNVLQAQNKTTDRIDFIRDEEQEMFRALQNEAFEVQVGLHELLGHGSGKLLSETEPNKLNFERAVIDPLTGQPVATWYKLGQTWNSVFGKLSTSYEECRAEAVGLFLSTDPKVLAIFGHGGPEASDITYANWLLMARAGISSLGFYNPDTKSFGQAHMNARYVLLRVMLEAGNGLLSIERDAEGRVIAHLDRSKIESVGRPAIGEFLKKLGIYKATANAEQGVALYERLSSVDEGMLKLREAVLAVKKPRHIWVQPVLDLTSSGDVILRTYPPTDQGVIQSFVDRMMSLR